MYSSHDWFEDVRAHCYCAFLLRTLFIGHAHAIFKRAHRVENSTKYRADDLCVILVCEYFGCYSVTPTFILGRSLPFPILSIILKNKKELYVGGFDYFSYTIQIGSNWYMDTAVRDLEDVVFKANFS